MADLQLVREEGDGIQTVLTVRVPDTAWEGITRTLDVVEHLVHVPERP